MATIGWGNWITGFPVGTDLPSFAHHSNRRNASHLVDHAAITNHHHIDCIHSITICPLSTIAGYHSQLLSHSIDPQHKRQHSESITIGAYFLVDSSCVSLCGSVLQDHCVLVVHSSLQPLILPWRRHAGECLPDVARRLFITSLFESNQPICTMRRYQQ
jgi:hypothetical protein